MRRLRTCIALLITALVMSMSVSPVVRTSHQSRVELTRAYASVDATSAWNSVCAQYEFPATTSVPSNYTFQQAWNMSMTHALAFDDAFAAIQDKVSQLMGTPDPGFSRSANCLYSIQNWPDQ